MMEGTGVSLLIHSVGPSDSEFVSSRDKKDLGSGVISSPLVSSVLLGF